MKIRTYWEAVEQPLDKRIYEVNNSPSLTIQEGYEDLAEMIPRIVRGEIRPFTPEFELTSSETSDEVFDRPVYDEFDDLTDIDKFQDIVTAARAQSEGSVPPTSVASEKRNPRSERAERVEATPNFGGAEGTRMPSSEASNNIQSTEHLTSEASAKEQSGR